MEEVERWLRRADTDARVARKLLDDGEEPWVITFHAEQAAEKYLKAYLTFKQIRFRKTHDILDLLSLCIESSADLEKLKSLDLEKFKEYATEFRYPTTFEPTKEEAEEAIKTAEMVKMAIMGKLENNK
jgi:HEPN domain-containing protein